CRRIVRAQGPGRRLFKGDGINPQRPLRVQPHYLLPYDQRVPHRGCLVRAGQGPPRRMDYLVQVAGGRLRGSVGPEEVHDLLPVKGMLGRQGQHLDQDLGLPQAPSLGRYWIIAYENTEAPEQADGQGGGRYSVTHGTVL